MRVRDAGDCAASARGEPVTVCPNATASIDRNSRRAIVTFAIGTARIICPDAACRAQDTVRLTSPPPGYGQPRRIASPRRRTLESKRYNRLVVPTPGHLALAPDIDAFRVEFERLSGEANAMVAPLTETQFNWQPAPGAWSVAECIEDRKSVV